MPATADQLTLARSWIGTAESDDDFNERFDRLGEDLDAAIEESLRAQLAKLVLDQPASVSTPDGMSVNFGDNIKALRETLKEFLNSGGTDPSTLESTTPSIARLERTQYR